MRIRNLKNGSKRVVLTELDIVNILGKYIDKNIVGPGEKSSTVSYLRTPVNNNLSPRKKQIQYIVDIEPV